MKRTKTGNAGGSSRTQFLLPLGILAAAAVMILLGVQNGEIGTVFRKATMICLECIGIG